MDNDYSSTSRPPCPSCGSRQILKNGSTHHKKQKFLCKECGRQFIEKPEKKQITLEQKQRVQKLLLERISLRGITRSLEISMTWLQKFVNSLYRSVPLELKVREISDLVQLNSLGVAEDDKLVNNLAAKHEDNKLH